MNKVLVINRCKTDNMGDEAIGICLSKLLKSEFKIEVITEDLCLYKGIPKMYSKKKNSNTVIDYLVKILSHLGCRKILWSIQNRRLFSTLRQYTYDFVFVGGGELLQSNYFFPLALDTWMKNINHYQPQAKCILFGVGVTNRFTTVDKKRISNALRFIDVIYVRDEASRQNLNTIFGKDSFVIPDVVLSQNLLCNTSREYILYGITDFKRISKYGIYSKSENEYFEKTYQYLLSIKTKEYGIKLFYTTNSDYISVKKFQSFVLEKYGELLQIANINSLDDLCYEMETAIEVYSPRMHGCILASVYGAKYHPIIISPKMKEFSIRYKDKINHEECHNLVIQAISDIFNNSYNINESN